MIEDNLQSPLSTPEATIQTKLKGWFLQLAPCWSLAVTPGLAPTSLSAVCPTHADESCAMLAQAVAHQHSSGEVKALIALYRVTDNIFTDTLATPYLSRK